jgi:hypothetical protein
LPKDGKVLSNFGFKSKVLPRRLTELSAWVGFYTSSPQQGVKYQLSYFDLVVGVYKYLYGPPVNPNIKVDI